MLTVELPKVDFATLEKKIQDGRFESKKILNFALSALDDIKQENQVITRAYQEYVEGNSQGKQLMLESIGKITSKYFTGKYPASTKSRQIHELKTLLIPFAENYLKLQIALTKEERTKEEQRLQFFSKCGQKKSQLLFQEQKEYQEYDIFNSYLEVLQKKFSDYPRNTIYFAYAWPTDEHYDKESWVQGFLKNLQQHLKTAGFSTVQLDIVSNRYGANINTFMEGANKSGYVLLFGTESLLDKFSTGISAVCSELIHILRKRERDGKQNLTRVFPILLSGNHRGSFPPEYERFSTIRDWRNSSYLHNFQQLFLELLALSPEDYHEKLTKYWNEVCQNDPFASWYQSQREAVEDCRRTGDEQRLSQIPILRK